MTPGDNQVKIKYIKIKYLIRKIYLMLNNLHRSITSWFTRAATEISMLRILRYLPFIALGLSYIYFTSC